MKILNLLLLLAATSMIFISCDDDDGGGDDRETLAGLWQIETLSNANCDDPQENQMLNLVDMPCIPDGLGGEICTEGSYNFMSNGTMVYNLSVTSAFGSFNITETYTYTTMGSAMEICDDQGDCDTGAYSIDGEVLTLSYVDPVSGCETDITARK